MNQLRKTVGKRHCKQPFNYEAVYDCDKTTVSKFTKLLTQILNFFPYFWGLKS